MAITGRYAKKSYRKRARRPRGRKPYAKRSSKIAKVVRKVLSSTLERKAWFFASANIGMTSAHNAQIETSPPTKPLTSNLIPQIVQGTGHSQRIGNEVSVSNAYIKGLVNIRAFDATNNPLPVPIWVKMWLVSYKVTNQPSLTEVNTFSQFFDSNNTSTGFQANTLDMILTPNKDVWTVHKTKMIKLGTSNTYNGISATPITTAGYFDNSPMSAPFYFNFTKLIHKLKFDDTVNNLCTNRNLFIIYQCVNADGQSSTYTPAEIHTSVRVEYTDA